VPAGRWATATVASPGSWAWAPGGRGIPVPEELWAEVVKVARVEGAGTTARALRLDRARLEARMAMDRGAEVVEASSGFIELDAGRLRLSPPTPRTVVPTRSVS
jgi:hypothetical protein